MVFATEEGNLFILVQHFDTSNARRYIYTAKCCFSESEARANRICSMFRATARKRLNPRMPSKIIPDTKLRRGFWDTAVENGRPGGASVGGMDGPFFQSFGVGAHKHTPGSTRFFSVRSKIGDFMQEERTDFDFQGGQGMQGWCE